MHWREYWKKILLLLALRQVLPHLPPRSQEEFWLSFPVAPPLLYPVMKFLYHSEYMKSVLILDIRVQVSNLKIVLECNSAYKVTIWHSMSDMPYLLHVLNVPGSELTVSRPCKQPTLLVQQDHPPYLQRLNNVALYYNTNRYLDSAGGSLSKSKVRFMI